jgi:hypothetical protein
MTTQQRVQMRAQQSLLNCLIFLVRDILYGVVELLIATQLRTNIFTHNNMTWCLIDGFHRYQFKIINCYLHCIWHTLTLLED